MSLLTIMIRMTTMLMILRMMQDDKRGNLDHDYRRKPLYRSESALDKFQCTGCLRSSCTYKILTVNRVSE